MQLGLENRRALVTGGNRGIGREIALTLAREGVHVAICGRDTERLSETRAALEATGARAAAIAGDLRAPGECERIVGEAAAALGGLELLVNNAGVNVDRTPADFASVTDEQITERLIGKTLVAARCTRAALPHLRRAGTGRIIFIAGVSARTAALPAGLPRNGALLVSGLGNAAITNLAKHLSAELVADGILVNVVHPGNTKTERYEDRVRRRAELDGTSLEEADRAIAAAMPLGRLVEPRDVAALTAFLCSPLADAITGQTIAVDGGTTPAIVY